MLARKALAGTAGAPKEYVEDVFSTYLYTGTGSNQTITNNIDISGKGGLVWIKGRPVNRSHHLVDTERGATKRLLSNATNAEATSTDSVLSFSSTGFSLGADTTTLQVNNSAENYVAWTFRQAKKFFDVVTYTGNGSNRTISHNLGSTPGCIIVKRTDAAAGWPVYHRSIGATKALELQITNAAFDSSSYWNNTEPTSTVFTVGTDNYVNASGGTYVAYLFAHDAGGFGDAGSDSIIKCGSFTTDGSGNATVDLGWEPQWLMFKQSSTTGDWNMFDNMRGIFTGSASPYVRANVSNAETNWNFGSINSKGFSMAYGPYASQDFIYIAIRRGPMKTPTSGTSVFTPTSAVDTTQNAIINAGFPVDLVIGKTKDNTNPPQWSTRMLGGSYLLSSATDAETAWNYVFFDSNVGYRVNASGTYLNSANTVNWMLRRAPGFFDVVCTTGDGSGNLSFTHNLGVAPDLVIIKSRTGTFNWYIYCSQLSQPTKTYGTFTNDALTASSNTYFTVSSTTVTTSAGGWVANNGAGVVYLFATLAGVSKVGTYTGNGSSQTVNCGFTNGARFILIKRTDSTGRWYVWDTARGITASTDPYLVLNNTVAEDAYGSFDVIDSDSSGFIVNQTTNVQANVDTATYIYLAIA